MNTNTPYDDVYRTMLSDCKELIIPMVNEIFNEQYDGISEENIVLLQNEIYVQQQNNEEKRITDSFFALVFTNGEVKKYHIECQSSPDGSMILRMFEYDSQIALSDRLKSDSEMTVNFPNSAVLFLRHNSKTPDQYTIRISTPGGSVSYQIPTIKVKEYSIEDIFDKHLFFLIPFHFFCFEGQLEEIDSDAEKLKMLQERSIDIVKRLDVAVKNGIIDEYTKQTICAMTKKVVEHLASKYNNIIKEVAEVMSGKILDYEAKDILNKGRNEGLEEGRKEGTCNVLVSLVKEKLLDINIAAKKAGLTLEDFTNLMNKM